MSHVISAWSATSSVHAQSRDLDLISHVISACRGQLDCFPLSHQGSQWKAEVDFKNPFCCHISNNNSSISNCLNWSFAWTRSYSRDGQCLLTPKFSFLITRTPILLRRWDVSLCFPVSLGLGVATWPSSSQWPETKMLEVTARRAS